MDLKSFLTECNKRIEMLSDEGKLEDWVKSYARCLPEKQREYFRAGNTLSYKFRKSMLLKLKSTLKDNEERILEALREDLGKSGFEGYATELGIAYEEINYLVKHLKHLMKKTHTATPITQAVSSSYIIHEPRGNTLIMSPWNYPVQLTIVPLAGAIAGGNTAIVKPSRYTL